MARRFLSLAVMLILAAPAGAQEIEPCEVAAPDVTRLGEAELRGIAEGLGDDRLEAIAELRRRFPSAAVRAFVANAEAREAAFANDARRAYDAYSRVRAEFAGNPDPEIELEVARAIAGQANALDLQEAIDTAAEPIRPITPGSIDENSPSYRLMRELVELFGDRTEPRIRALVGWQRYNLLQASALNRGAPYDAAPFLALAAEYSDSDHPDIVSFVAYMLFGVAMFEPDQARRLAHITAFVRRFARPPNDLVREHVYDAYSWKAGIEEEQGDAQAAARTRREADAWAERNPRRSDATALCSNGD
jgi:hypothetical protein